MTEHTDTDEPIRTESDGLTVEKRFEPKGQNLIHVVFTLEVEGEEPVDCRLVERIPEAFPGDKVGFHPEYGRDRWSVEGRSLVYEATVGPEEEHVALYGIKAAPSELDPLRREPVVAVHPDAPFDADEANAGGATPVDADGDLGGDRDATAGADGDATAGADGDGDPTGASRGDDAEDGTDGTGGDDDPFAGIPSGTETTGGDPVEGDATGPGDEPNGQAPDADGDTGGVADVLPALVAELREDGLSEEERATLREALGVEAGGNTNTLEARVRHVQRAVDDLEAYRDALDELIADHGSDETIVDRFECELESLQDSLADVRGSVAEADDRMDGLATEEDLDAVEERTGEVERRHETLSERVDAVEERLDAVEQAVADLETGLDGVREEVDAAREWRRRVDQATVLPGTERAGDAAGNAGPAATDGGTTDEN